MTNEQKTAFLTWLGNTEGFRPRLYYCPAGVPTIGYGHACLTIKEIRLYENYTMRLTEAKNLLKQDFDYALSQVACDDIMLSENEHYAVAELAFNIGVSRVMNSGLWKLLKMYSNAIDKHSFSYAELLKNRIANKFLEFCKYHNNKGVLVESDGLRARRNMDKELFLGTSYILK